MTWIHKTMCRIFTFIIQFSPIYRIVHLKPPLTKWKFLLNTDTYFWAPIMCQALCPAFYTYNLIEFLLILIKPLQEKKHFTHFINDEIGFHRGEVTCTHIHTHTHKEQMGELSRIWTEVSQKLLSQTIIVSPSVYNISHTKCIRMYT